MTPLSDRLPIAIEEEALKLIRRQEKYASMLAEEFARRRRRDGIVRTKVVHRPSYWHYDPGFDPYYVRKHAARIARAMLAAVTSDTYRPRAAVAHTVPKRGGGRRNISIFQIADNALSRLVFHDLMIKNASRFSAYCYAYRPDVSAHDAIVHFSSHARGKHRLFVAEFDFSKYFESIHHEPLIRSLENPRFYKTKSEVAILQAFMRTPVLEENQLPYDSRAPERTDGIGIRLGTSTSLFLANVAGYPIDEEIESHGVKYVRYADDTLLWSEDYASVSRAVSGLTRVASSMGVRINPDKSEGISLLSTLSPEKIEMRNKRYVEILGYRVDLSDHNISIRDDGVARIKRNMAWIIYTNLLDAPRNGTLQHRRLAPTVDRDYVVMIVQLRRYLYGGMTEQSLQRHLSRTLPKLRLRGVMSFYPIVNDEVLLKALDGWLLHTVYTTLQLRARLLVNQGHAPAYLPRPHGLSKSRLRVARARTIRGKPIDLRLPSFVRIARLAREASTLHGIAAISGGNAYY